MTDPIRVLVLCTGNSARSQMAEALLNRLGQGTFAAESAGSEPVERVNPLAIRVLAEVGIDWAGRVPRRADALPLEGWDLVVTVCDDAQEACPVFPGRTLTAHWGQPDPAAVAGSESDRLEAFRKARDLLGWRVQKLAALGLRRDSVGSHREAIRGIGQAAPGGEESEV